MINISNHPSNKWTGKQADDAGEVLDFPFPPIPTSPDFLLIRAAEEYWVSISDEVADHVTRTGDRRIHIMGEMGFTFRLVQVARLAGYVPVHSCTERIIEENPETGEKTSRFIFQGFRNYYS